MLAGNFRITSLLLFFALIQGAPNAHSGYAGLPNYSQPHPHVDNSQDFIKVMQLHRERVKIIARDILINHSDKFPDLKPAQIEKYITEIHDAGKLQDPMASALFRYWGTRIESLSKEQQARGHEVIEQLNLDESIKAQKFFNRNRWSKALRNQCKIVETMADRIDRSLSPLSRQEFGKMMKPASKFAADEIATKYWGILRSYETDRAARYRRLTEKHQFQGTKRAPRYLPASSYSKDACVYRAFSHKFGSPGFLQ